MGKTLIEKVTSVVRNLFRPKYDFNKSNPLGGNGERVDILIRENLEYKKLDVYQKSHIKRYELAKELIREGDTCGDFACGTGYGSILLSTKANRVIGADINCKVIDEIKERYEGNTKVSFFCKDVLMLDYTDFFDNIISFETLEHLEEDNLKKALWIFNKALKKGGQFFFSTPYMQEKSENAIKLGFHLTFFIDEQKITRWLNEAGFDVKFIKYQNYDTHVILDSLKKKDFIIGAAVKK